MRYIIGILLAVIIFLFIRGCVMERKIERLTASNKYHRALYDSCLGAEVESDTIIVERAIHDTIYIDIPVPIYDTIIEPGRDTIIESIYTDTAHFSVADVVWSARVRGELVGLEILPPTILKERIIETVRTIQLPPKPTQPADCRGRTHLYLMPGAGFNHGLRTFNTDLVVIFRRGFGLSGGVEYNMQHEAVYFRAGFAVRLK